jgi:hypothetical protein
MAAQFVLQILMKRWPWELLEAGPGATFFRPVALGARDETGERDAWLLAGCALEDFVARQLGRMGGSPRPGGIELAFTDAATRKYLEVITLRMFNPRPAIPHCSPFERVAIAAQATFLEGPPLDGPTVTRVRSWCEQHPHAWVEVFGVVDLAADEPGELPWSQAFRELDMQGDGRRPLGWPFLTLFVRRPPGQLRDDFVEVILSTRSAVWLEGQRALGGRVSPRAAEENLRRLSSMVEPLAREAEETRLHLPPESAALLERERLSRALLRG